MSDSRLDQLEAAVEKFTKAIARLEQAIQKMPQPTGFTVVVECQNCNGLGHANAQMCPGCKGAGVQRI